MGLTTLHITNSYHPTSGGIRTFYNALIDVGNAMGGRVCLVVPGPRSSVEDVGSLGRIYHVAAPQAPAFDRRYRMILPHAFLPWRRAPLSRSSSASGRTWWRSATSTRCRSWPRCCASAGIRACRARCSSA